MKIQFISDLHNEGLRAEYRIEATGADVVVLAGDINVGTVGVEWAAREAERLGIPIIYVAGNHEYYGGEYFSILARQRDAAKGTGVLFLECDSVVLGDVRFLGATLWTDFRGTRPEQTERAKLEAKAHIRDFHRIRTREELREPTSRREGDVRYFAPDDAARVHREAVKWLGARLEEPHEGKTVVVTHFGPHPGTQHPGYPVGLISPYFWSDLGALVEQADLWIYGHSHGNLPPFAVGKCRIVSNQCGYQFEETGGFSPGRCVTI